MKSADGGIDEVLRFWFEETKPEQHFVKDAAFDRTVATRFARLNARAAAGRCDAWAATARGALALVILLDQFPRNIFRDDPRAFADDARALATAKGAIARGLDLDLDTTGRVFLYMPFQHSEDIADQMRSVELFAGPCGDEKTLAFARAHLATIERFGRFPHRNAVLGRENTPEEAAYLETPDAGF